MVLRGPQGSGAATGPPAPGGNPGSLALERKGDRGGCWFLLQCQVLITGPPNPKP